MRISSRFVVGFTIISALALTLVQAAPAYASAQTSSRAATTNYAGTHGSVSRLASAPGLPTTSVGNAQTKSTPRMTPEPGHNTTNANRAATNRGAPQVSSTALAATSEGQLLHNFNGISDRDQAAVNGGLGGEVTPPDQGLCAGILPPLGGAPKSAIGTKVVWEIINDAVAVYAPNGTLLLGPVAVTTFFQDPLAFSDPRCFYDIPAHTFFFTDISSKLDLTHSGVDLVVINARGFAKYRIDTTLGGQCFGDQPHDGYNSDAFYISTDEFCGPPNFNTEQGALLFGLSKPQLVAESPAVNFAVFGLLSLGGVPITTLEPAFGDDSGVEYLLNSFPFDQFGNNNSIANTLGFWEVHGDANITSGSGFVSLSARVIPSELYAFPVPAASTGTGAITCVPFVASVGCKNGILVESEPFLNPDDDRMLQVQLVNDATHGLQLYAALDSAVLLPGDPSNRDGAAWFVLNPKTRSITKQGYVAVKGSYLLYPAILHTPEGTTAMAFTITNPTLNPSAADVVWRSTSSSFGPVAITALGAGPHLSFAGPVFNSPRWGDYSAEELDPNGLDIWSATEYIPPAADQDPVDNWGTRVWDVKGA